MPFFYYSMYTYNITFVVAPEKEPELLAYLREELILKIFNKDSGATKPELKKVVETGGEKPGPEHGLSIALAANLPSEEAAHHWNDHTLLPELNNFHLKFKDQALFFVTLLENLYI
ncbi:MAG: DUF4286 family protein [Muribaculaceae bacterium]|nr:DUF4286 family protein [Muribaculaceae bacterium]